MKEIKQEEEGEKEEGEKEEGEEDEDEGGEEEEEEEEEEQSQKRHMVSGTQCPYVSVCGCVMVRGAAAPKGPMTYAQQVWRL